MRRLSIVTLFMLFLTAALLPAEKNFIARAVSESERLPMFSKPSVVRIIEGVAGNFYYAPPRQPSGKTYTASYVGLGREFFVNSHSYHVIQSDPQSIADGEEKSNISMWAVVAIVLVILFFIVVIIVVGVTVFFIARKRSKAKPVTAGVSTGGIVGSGAAKQTPSYGAQTPSAQSAIAASAPASYSPSFGPSNAATSESTAQFGSAAAEGQTVDLFQTIAIAPQSDMAHTSYGSIRFVSGVLAGQTFDITPDGACIGRDSTLSQIVIADPRISKRHVWIGVRDGLVTIADQGSRNGTFVNDPKSRRATEVALNDGDTVILGESDVARFEYQK